MYPTPEEIAAVHALEASLYEEYERWCKEQKLPWVDAQELRLHEELTEEQREWLEDFITRWEGWEEKSSDLYDRGYRRFPNT